MSTFETSKSLLLTSESVTEGHPDKMCDQISDAILDAILTDDPMGRVACESACTTGLVVVMGEITTDTYIEIPNIVREVVKDIGYDDATYGFDYETCGVMVSVHDQSEDIARGVNKAKDAKLAAKASRNGSNGHKPPKKDDLSTGAGDQGMMYGFACNETKELMPLTISLAHRLCRQLTKVRKNGTLPYLRPDGKSQVTIEYANGKPKRIDTVVISTQHHADVSQAKIRRDIIDKVIMPVLPKSLLKGTPTIHVNPTGRFVTGGPKGDAGLTGRKIIVDTYGGIARHGGGAFSGKDPTKVDRSAAYAARWVAKNIVAAGLADRVELALSYAIGVANPTSMAVETFGTARVDDAQILRAVKQVFDLRPGAIIRDLDLRRPIYRKTAAYGHFGRDDLKVPWEQTSRVAELQAAAGAIRARVGVAARPS